MTPFSFSMVSKGEMPVSSATKETNTSWIRYHSKSDPNVAPLPARHHSASIHWQKRQNIMKRKSKLWSSSFHRSLLVAIMTMVFLLLSSSILLYVHWWECCSNGRLLHSFNRKSIEFDCGDEEGTYNLIEPSRHQLPGSYRSIKEMNGRHERFPNVDLRVKVYMSNWYNPPSPSCGSCFGLPKGSSNLTLSSQGSNYIQYQYISGTTGRTHTGSTAPSPLLILNEFDVSPPTEQYNLSTPPTAIDKNQNNSKGNNHGRTFVLDSQSTMSGGSRIFFFSANEIRRCHLSACNDIVQFMFPSLHRINMGVSKRVVGQEDSIETIPSTSKHGYVGNGLGSDGNRNMVVPIIFQFGDLELSRAYTPKTHRNETYPIVPIFKKFRLSISKQELQRITTISSNNDKSNVQYCSKNNREVPMTSVGGRHLQPIIFKLTYKRHYGMLENIPAADIPWRDKKNAAIWRGALTGINRNGTRNMQDLVTSSSTIDANQTAVCLTLQRCKLVYEHASSHLVNASLTSVVAYHPNNRFRTSFLPNVLEDGVHLVGPHLSYTDLLQYKALIMLEGNDISSGLKWALYSNSVVLMQRVTYTSWAMEELLEPWVHYIPLADDLSDVEEKVQWVLDHDEKAQQIAHSGSLWISDLVYHPDAFGDEELIIDESIHRYKEHFVLNPTLYENHVLSL